MKIVYRSIICIGIATGLYACKEQNKAQLVSSIAFTKEGTAQLYKASSDSLIASFDIEIAKTEYETQTGLMYRDSMKTDRGMLFIFDNASPRYFYMKNTRLPLDIIYISEDKKIVSFYENAEPFNESSLPSEAPAKYVLEINGGLIEKLGISVGDSLDYSED